MTANDQVRGHQMKGTSCGHWFESSIAHQQVTKREPQSALGKRSAELPLWVINRSVDTFRMRLLFAQKRTSPNRDAVLTRRIN